MKIQTSFASVLLAALCAVSPVQANSENGQSGKEHSHAPFDFALIGDLPYTTAQEPKFVTLLQKLNEQKLAFVVHDGDFKSGSSVCSDELFAFRYDQFQTIRHPFVFVFGDNEWTDCHRANNGGYEPLERLEFLRALFTQGDTSLGRRTINLDRQSNRAGYSKFRENVRWSHGQVLFVGLHVVGSNNNFGRTASADAEYAERNAANLAFLEESFALAKANDLKAVMIVMQANPNFELPATHVERTGFNDTIKAFERHSLNFKRPVVLVHGDTHYFRIDKPLLGTVSKSRIENFTRVETFGSPDVHWLRASVNLRDPNVFQFKQELVQENLVNHAP